MPELCLPFFAVRWCFMLEMYKGEHMRQLMQQRYQEAVWVKVCIDTDTVVRGFRYRMAVVAQYALAFMRKGKVYGMRCEKRSYLLICATWQKLF